MNSLRLHIFFTFVLFMMAAQAHLDIHSKGLYGENNRRLISELSGNEFSIQRSLARSVLAQVPKWRINSEDKETITIKTKSLRKGMNFCADELFADLPLVSSCSAFLVGPNLILTAAHCVKNEEECKDNYWVLDYDDDLGFSPSTGVVKLKRENIVSCSQLLSISENPKLDYALIQINRTLSDRSPLKLRRRGVLSKNDSLEVIGHPMGLPKIFTDQARVIDNSLPTSFLSNADTFTGNSGSPVINSRTHLVEGILIRGGRDLFMDLDLGCNRFYQCIGDECIGETVLRSTALPLNIIPKS